VPCSIAGPLMPALTLVDMHVFHLASEVPTLFSLLTLGGSRE
jgi:hypothetical protein